jgi:hypothetical protein
MRLTFSQEIAPPSDWDLFYKIRIVYNTETKTNANFGYCELITSQRIEARFDFVREVSGFKRTATGGQHHVDLSAKSTWLRSQDGERFFACACLLYSVPPP